MKKFLAIFLTVAMLASFMVVPALAAVDAGIYYVPGNHVSPTLVTGKLANISGEMKFEYRNANDVAQPIASVDAGANFATVGFTANDTSVTIKVAPVVSGTTDRVPTGAVNAITLTIGSDDYVFFAQAGTTSNTKLDSLKIKSPSTNVLVEGQSVTLKLDKNPANSDEAVYWFSSVPDALTVPTLPSDEVTVVARAVDGTTTVEVRAISQSGKQDVITLFVLKGVDATGIAFNKGIYEVAANEDNTVDLVTTISPSNGRATNLTYSIVGGTDDTVNGVDYSDLTIGTINVSLNKATGEFKIEDEATVAPVYPLFVTVQATVDKNATSSVKFQANAVVKINEPTAVTRRLFIENAPTSGKLGVGQTYQYTGVVYKIDTDPRKSEIVKDAKIEWFSSKPSVATVDKATGLVTAVAKGTANIIAVSAGTINQESTLTVVPKDEIATGTVKYVAPGKLAVRALADYKSTKIGELKQGTLVDVLDVTGIYSKIAYDGSFAYVASEYLASPVNFTVTSSKLAVRSFPGATATLKTLVYGESVKVIGKYASNPAWTAILLDDTTVAYVASANIAEGAQVGVVTAGSLTFRVGASTTSAAYAQKLVNGQTVEIVGKEGSFLKVKTAEGFVGFAAAAYIEVL